MIVRAKVMVVEYKEVKVPDECAGLLEDYDEVLEEMCLEAICDKLGVCEEDIYSVTDDKYNPMIERD